MDLLHRTKVGRDINRHYYTPEEVTAALDKPMVGKLFDLARFRNSHPAFDGDFAVEQPSANRLVLRWTKGDDSAALDVDFKTMTATIKHQGASGKGEFIVG
jgi:sucrose phosphorylase